MFTPDEERYLSGLDGQEREQAEAAINELRNHFTNVLQSDSGRAVLWWLLSQCKVFSGTMTGNAWSNYNEGQRSIGLMLINEVVAADPKQWIELQRENMLSMLNELESNPKEKKRG